MKIYEDSTLQPWAALSKGCKPSPPLGKRQLDLPFVSDPETREERAERICRGVPRTVTTAQKFDYDQASKIALRGHSHVESGAVFHPKAVVDGTTTRSETTQTTEKHDGGGQSVARCKTPNHAKTSEKPQETGPIAARVT